MYIRDKRRQAQLSNPHLRGISMELGVNITPDRVYQNAKSDVESRNSKPKWAWCNRRVNGIWKQWHISGDGWESICGVGRRSAHPRIGRLRAINEIG